MMCLPSWRRLIVSTHLQVIKVESMRQADSARGLGPSPARGMGSMFLGSGRSKQSVMLNLAPGEAGEAGRKVFLRLAKECDVLIQNFRPGSMERMGLDYEAVKKVNPDIIYLSSAGFGPTGPYSGTRIYDPIIQSLSGICEMQKNKDGSARVAAQIVFDKGTAQRATAALTAALVARDNGHGGQEINMSMLDAALEHLWCDGYQNDVFLESDADKAPEAVDTPEAKQAAQQEKVSPTAAVANNSKYFTTTSSSIPLFGKFKEPVLGSAVRFSGTPVSQRPSAPMMGEHTVKVLGEAGYSEAQIAALMEGGTAMSTESLMTVRLAWANCLLASHR